MKDLDKIDWDKVADLLRQYDTCMRCVNELDVLVNTEAAAALQNIRAEIIEEIGGEDTTPP